MGRPSKTQTLSLWANGLRVGTWSVYANANHELQYDDSWIGSVPGRPLSLSLPFLPANAAHKGEVVQNYFDNLLPDSEDIRRRLAKKFKASGLSAFELLKEIGRDCVGAIQLLGPDEEPGDIKQIHSVALDEAGVAQVLRGAVTSNSLGMLAQEDQELRISIAGAQEKTALLKWNDAWHRPLGPTPTTHIFKLPLGLIANRKLDFSDSVDNEWLCLALLREMGLRTAQATIETFEDQRVLCVQRFDRARSADGTHLLRLPQEDFCQALGRSYLDKYEAEGGPGLADIARILRNAEDPQEDLRTLLKAQLMFWLLRAPDQHAKNFSLFLKARGRYRLTPLYDVLSAWPVLGKGPNQWNPYELKLAMAMRGKNVHYKMVDIKRRHFNSTAARLGYGANMEEIIEEVLSEAPLALSRVHASLPEGFSDRVRERIFKGVQDSLAALASQPKS